jgi:1,4-alpha-glucan branching enzyme
MALTKSAMAPRKPALKRIVFTLKADTAREVVLTGDFTGWATDKLRLARGADGEWRTSLELAPGEYQYKLIVDGVWCDHSEAIRRVPNPYGTHNCVLAVS